MMKLPRTLGWAIGIMIVCTMGACRPYGDLCQRKMDCLGGNDADYDACLVDYDETDDLSSLHNCDDFLDRYLDCLDTNVRCKNNVWTDSGDCANESQDLFDCIK